MTLTSTCQSYNTTWISNPASSLGVALCVPMNSRRRNVMVMESSAHQIIQVSILSLRVRTSYSKI